MRRKFRWVGWCLFWFGTGALAWWRGGEAAWFLFAGIAVIAVYLFLFSCLTLHHVRAAVVVEQDGFVVHDHVPVHCVIRFRSWFPVLWLQLEQVWQNEVKKDEIVFRQGFVPIFRRKISTTYQLANVQRGRYQLMRTTLMTNDLFGWIIKRKDLHLPTAFTVYPKPMIIHHRIAEPNETGSFTSHPLYRHDSSLFSHVRDYVHGDPFNRIHWKSSAKANGLKTKEIERVLDPSFTLFLDAHNSLSHTEQSIACFEKSVQVTASILQEAETCRVPVRFVCNNKQLYQTPVNMFNRMRGLYHFLATVCPDGVVPLDEILSSQSSRLPIDSGVMCVTAHVNECLFAEVQKLRSRKIQVHIILVYNDVELPWHYRFWKRQFESTGCLFEPIRSLGIDWIEQGRNDVAGA